MKRPFEIGGYTVTFVAVPLNALPLRATFYARVLYGAKADASRVLSLWTGILTSLCATPPGWRRDLSNLINHI